MEFRDPVSSRRYLWALALIALLTAPWPFVGRSTTWAFGLPSWLWWSLGMTVALSALTSWAILRLWRDGD